MGKTYQFGDIGDVIRTTKIKLQSLGFYNGSLDGIFNDDFAFSIQTYQKSKNLLVTGKLDDSVLTAIDYDVERYNLGKKTSGLDSAEITSYSTDTSAGTNTNTSKSYPKTNNLSFGSSKPTMFTGEYTVDEIQNKLNTMYNNAPTIVKNRAASVKATVKRAQAKLDEMYITEKSSAMKTNNTEVAQAIKLSTNNEISSFGSADKKSTTEKSSITTNHISRWPATLRQGDSGSYVKELQRLLIDLGYSVGTKKDDGLFGKDTKAGVIAYQSSHKLAQDGIVGPKTKASFISELA